MQELMIFYGLFIGLIIDILWWKVPSLQKADKFEAHEHYHISLEFGILFMMVYSFTQAQESFIILGMAIAFLLGEWDQLKEIVGVKVKPGHPFAMGSSHFKASTIIGLILAVITVFTYLYLPTILN